MCLCGWVQYAKLEEEFGLVRHAMAVYDRAAKAVPEDKRYDMFLLYIKKVRHDTARRRWSIRCVATHAHGAESCMRSPSYQHVRRL